MAAPTEPNLKEALAAITRMAQKASDSIVEAFKKAQLDPEKAAQIKDIATRLQAIRDRNA